MARDPWQDERLIRTLARERGRLRWLVPPGGVAPGPSLAQVWVERQVRRGEETTSIVDLLAHGPVLLSGPPGSGRSSLLRWLGWHLADPVAIIATPSERTTRGVERRLAAVWSAVERACEREDFRPNPGRLCDWCAFKAYCPAFGGDISKARVQPSIAPS